jgi:hypothetical protein
MPAKGTSAWAQLFVSSILSGCAVWRLLRRVFDLGATSLLASLAGAYERARDILMLPFSWVHVPLTPSDKDFLALDLVLLGALARATQQHPQKRFVEIFSLVAFAGYFCFLPPPLPGTHMWVGVISADIFAIAILDPVISLERLRLQKEAKREHSSSDIWIEDPTEAADGAFYWFVVSTILATGFWAIVLLLLDSA